MEKVTFKMFNQDGTVKLQGSIKASAVMYPPKQPKPYTWKGKLIMLCITLAFTSLMISQHITIPV